MTNQSVENQKGEIEFRKKLYQQQVEGKAIFDDEFDSAGIAQILRTRMKKTLSQMALLREKGITLSPYLEIGAERGQRSLVMENDLGLHGVAADISFDMLRSCDHYREVLGQQKSPLRVCCDANNLPFASGSIPFVFCYETLHHFPAPAPITKEIHRVLLPGGCFFFDEEPFKQVLHVNLYQGKHVYSRKTLTRTTMRKVLDRFFCAKTCNEVEHGIIEYHDIPIELWKEALAHFDDKDVELQVIGPIHSKLYKPSSYARFFAAYLLGGNISGLCRKSGTRSGSNRDIPELMICPSCREESNREVRLAQSNKAFLCPACSKIYPVVDGVLFLLAYDRFRELYPDILNTFQKGKETRS